VLDAAPGADSYIRVNFGHLDGTSCDAHTEFASLVSAPSAGFARNGRTVTLDAASDAAGYQDWDCAFVALTNDLSGSPTQYSVLIGGLTDVLARPVLRITSVENLGSRKVRLVRGVPTVLEVEVENSGRADAESVRLTGRGKGLKVKRVAPEKAFADGSSTYRLVVTLTGRKKTTLKLTASGGGVTTKRSVTVKPQAAPAPPSPGGYRSKDGDVTFTISKARKIQGFLVYTQTQCGGYPDLPTYTMNTYSFETTKIPRSGIVNAIERGDLYTARLALLVKGGKVTKGRFSYSGPARCFAVETFTAKRTRK
jgi:hypothetical protein